MDVQAPHEMAELPGAHFRVLAPRAHVDYGPAISVKAVDDTGVNNATRQVSGRGTVDMEV